ncbi:long-chain fatty acid-CoA ligase, partial [Linderina macrospora]
MKSQYFQSVELEGTGSVHETPVHRYPTATHKLMDSALPNLLTVYDALQYRIGQEPDKKSLGKRSIIEIVTKDKQVKRTVNGTVETSTKKWSYFRLSDYSWMTYKEIGEATKSLGSGFVHLGLKRDSRVMVYAPTSREWMLCALASYSQGMQVVTAYDTLGEEGVLHAMNQAKVELVFMHVDQMPVMAKVIDRAETVRKIVVFHDAYGMPDKASQALEVVKTKRD